MVPTFVADFQRAWDELGDANEVVEAYSLTSVASVKGLFRSKGVSFLCVLTVDLHCTACTSQIVDVLGMMPAESSDVVKDRATTHALYLAGTFVGAFPALAKCRMAYEPGSGVAMEITVRSTNEGVSTLIANAIV
jgi:coatomer protein complex subunit gamma